MAKYKGKTVRVNTPAAEISERFADLSVLENYLDRIPAEHRDQIGQLRFEPDCIILINPSIGEMKFKMESRSPEKIVFAAEGFIPLTINIDLAEVDAANTDITTTLDIEIPMMLRPLIGGKLQQVADMFGELIAKLSSTPASEE